MTAPSCFLFEPVKVVLAVLAQSLLWPAPLHQGLDDSQEDEEPWVQVKQADWEASDNQQCPEYRPYSKQYLAALKAARVKQVPHRDEILISTVMLRCGARLWPMSC